MSSPQGSNDKVRAKEMVKLYEILMDLANGGEMLVSYRKEFKTEFEEMEYQRFKELIAEFRSILVRKEAAYNLNKSLLT